MNTICCLSDTRPYPPHPMISETCLRLEYFGYACHCYGTRRACIGDAALNVPFHPFLISRATPAARMRHSSGLAPAGAWFGMACQGKHGASEMAARETLLQGCGREADLDVSSWDRKGLHIVASPLSFLPSQLAHRCYLISISSCIFRSLFVCRSRLTFRFLVRVCFGLSSRSFIHSFQ